MASEPIQQISWLSDFSCLGAECEDTCCRGWSMQVDPVHANLYASKATELLEAIAEDETGCIMKRDPESGFCVKYEQGLCSIHRDYGEEFLGDACFTYPRVFRRIGGQGYMGAMLSCPEVVRVAVMCDNTGDRYHEQAVDRLPAVTKDYLPENVSVEQADAVMKSFLENAAREDLSPEQIMKRLITVSRALQVMPESSWPALVPLNFKIADSRMLKPEPDKADAFRLLHSLAGLVSASPSFQRDRFWQVFESIETALEIRIDRSSLVMTSENGSLETGKRLAKKWREHVTSSMQSILRRWIQAQLSASCYPFGGLGDNLVERSTILAVRFALVRLGLIAAMGKRGEMPGDDRVVQVIQSIARAMDHLGDATLSMTVYKDVEWHRETRLLGLMEL